jgi:chemotaxis signal transduction protein
MPNQQRWAPPVKPERGNTGLDGPAEYLCFSLGGENHAVRLAHVQSIQRCNGAMPQTLLDRDGRPMPLFDLRGVHPDAACPAPSARDDDEPPGYVIVCELQAQCVGLLAHALHGVKLREQAPTSPGALARFANRSLPGLQRYARSLDLPMLVTRSSRFGA